MIEIIGPIIGLVGVTIAIYSIRRQRILENRVKEKERLKALTEKLKVIIKTFDSLYNAIENPLTDMDLQSEIELFSNKVVSEAFDGKKHVVEVVSPMLRYRWIERDGETETEDLPFEKGKALEYLESSEDNISMLNYVSGRIFFELFKAPKTCLHLCYRELEKMEEFTDIIENFSVGLMKDLKEQYSKIATIMINSAVGSNTLRVKIKKFKKTRDIGLWVYRQIIGYEELKPHLSKLNSLKERLEKLRNDVAIASYA